MREAKDNGEQASGGIQGPFEATLNRHGYPFQYAVARRARELRDERRSPWGFEASEFPVEVQGRHTRIDLILSQWGQALPGVFRYLVAECKRVNPALAHWVFLRAPFTRRGGVTRDLLVEGIQRDGRDLFAGLSRLDGSDRIYHVALEVRGTGKGESAGTGRGAIEEAATQVIRGVNGLIEYFDRRRRYVPDKRPITFIPAIFTTAKIWTSAVNLSATDIAKGAIASGAAELEPAQWLWLQYHVSPGLQHSVDRQFREDDRQEGDLGLLLELEYARTIAVVSSTGVDEFLASQRWTF